MGTDDQTFAAQYEQRCTELIAWQAAGEACFEKAASIVFKQTGISPGWFKLRFMLMSEPTAGVLRFKDSNTRVSMDVKMAEEVVLPGRDVLKSRIGSEDPLWDGETAVQQYTESLTAELAWMEIMGGRLMGTELWSGIEEELERGYASPLQASTSMMRAILTLSPKVMAEALEQTGLTQTALASELAWLATKHYEAGQAWLCAEHPLFGRCLDLVSREGSLTRAEKAELTVACSMEHPMHGRLQHEELEAVALLHRMKAAHEDDGQVGIPAKQAVVMVAVRMAA